MAKKCFVLCLIIVGMLVCSVLAVIVLYFAYLMFHKS